VNSILIVGNHSCSNRGDAAILRGLIDYLDGSFPNSNVDFMSRYVDGAKWFFDKKVINDPLAEAKKNNVGIKGKFINFVVREFVLPLFVAKKIKNEKFLPNAYGNFLKLISDYDLVIQVGGSFFVDLYGSGQFEAAAICINSGKPIVMLGHSVGPFYTKGADKIARAIFEGCDGLVLRERLSEKVLFDIGLSRECFINGGDTAWLIDPDKYIKSDNAILFKDMLSRPCVAITARELSPFNERLGITQPEYEIKMANLCKTLIDEGYNVIAASTCTGLDSYHKDDRMVGLRIGGLVNQPDHYMTVMDELTDIQLGQLLAKCKLTIGTRLHSAILSMRFGTPAFAIFYEHKSLGVLEQMGLKEYSVKIHDMDSEAFKEQVINKLVNIDNERKEMLLKVEEEVGRCKNALDSTLKPFLK